MLFCLFREGFEVVADEEFDRFSEMVLVHGEVNEGLVTYVATEREE